MKCAALVYNQLPASASSSGSVPGRQPRDGVTMVSAARGGKAVRRPARSVWAGAVCAAALSLPFLAGCSSDSEIRTTSVALEVAPNANANSALAVDLVLVLDGKLVAQFAQLSAADWFKNRAQLQTANPTGIAVQSFEVIPGQSGPRYKIPSKYQSALGAFIYADYPGKDVNRAQVDGLEEVVVKLGAKSFTVGPPS